MHKLSNKKRLFIFILLGVAIYFLSGAVDELRVYQGATVAVYVVGIASIILLTGYSGQVSLGQGALLGVGGYAAALMRIHFDLPIWMCFAVAILAAAIAGALLGLAAARLSGPYLAGTTLAFAVGLPSVANQFELLGGEQGLLFDVGFPPLSFGEDFTQYKWFFWIASLATLIAIFWLQNVMRSRYGRSWKAVRGNDVAAELAGINLTRNKTLAFTLSAGLAGLSGALLAMTIGTVSPSAFPLALSFSLLTGAVIAGVTTLGGVMIGAVTLVAIPDIAGAVASRFGSSEAVTSNLPGLLVSALLILTVLFVPNGPVEQLRARREHRVNK
ncbi:branched-chain amino acid ABC transporter permease [Candidatus Planktophila dulcis]|uniref:branched-chain amino acid ABC transporter permease n=1 Tax=Candidatus Planktophila dulcis TaxID=1884914 RepID=UPI003CFB6592